MTNMTSLQQSAAGENIFQLVRQPTTNKPQSFSDVVTSGQIVLKTFAPEDYLNPIPRKESQSDSTKTIINQPTKSDKCDTLTDSSKLSILPRTSAITDDQAAHVASNNSRLNVSRQRGKQKPNVDAIINEVMEKKSGLEKRSSLQSPKNNKERKVRKVQEDRILPIVIKPLQPDSAVTCTPVRKGSRKRNPPRKIEIALFKTETAKRPKKEIPNPHPSLKPVPKQERHPRDRKARTNKTDIRIKAQQQNKTIFKKSAKAMKQNKDKEKTNISSNNEKQPKSKGKKRIVSVDPNSSDSEGEKDPYETIKPKTPSGEPPSKLLEFCKICLEITNHDGEEKCPFDAPKIIVPNDNQNRLLFGLPPCLTLGRSRITPTKYSIYARDEILPYTQFGPLKGDGYRPEELDLTEVDVAHLWTTEYKNKIFPKTFLYTKEAKASNYLRFLQPHTPGSNTTYNTQQLLKPDGIYFLSTKIIKPGEELVMRCLEFPHRVYRGIETRSDLPLIDWKTSCAQCNLDFGTLLYKIRHRLLVHNANPGMYAFGPCYMCWRCEEEFKQVKDYMAHVKALHCQQDLYCCILCQSTFQQRVDYERHMRSHRGQPSTCDTCEETFPSLAAMRAHAWDKHAHAESQHPIHTRRALSQTPSKTETCDQCGKLFTDAHNHRQHYLTHTGLKPFSCPMPRCSHATTTKQCMQHHLRKIHMLADELHPEIVANFYFTIENQKKKYREIHGREVGDSGDIESGGMKGSSDDVTSSEETPTGFDLENDVTATADDVSEDDEEIANHI